MFVKPNTGRTVRDPVKGTLLPEAGADVPDNNFWRRRLRDEDVSIVRDVAISTTVTTTAQTSAPGATATNTAASTAATAAEDSK